MVVGMGRVQWVLLGVVVACVAGGVGAYALLEVCDEQLTQSDSAARVCRHLQLSDPPVVAIGLVTLAALGGFFTEVSGLGFSLKREVQKLEDKAEQDYGTAIEELRAELADLRKSVNAETPAASENAIDFVRHAISLYERHRAPTRADARARVDVDKQLRSNKARLAPEQARQLLDEAQPRSQSYQVATALALAVVLGSAVADEDQSEVARQLAAFLYSPHERVRFRAAQSVRRRAQHSGMSRESLEILSRAVDDAHAAETAELVAEQLSRARTALRMAFAR